MSFSVLWFLCLGQIAVVVVADDDKGFIVKQHKFAVCLQHWQSPVAAIIRFDAVARLMKQRAH